MKRIMLALCLLTGVAFGQIRENFYSAGRVNCRNWNAHSHEWQRGYVISFSDLVNDMPSRASLQKVFVTSKITDEETATAITTLCAPPENGVLPIIAVITAFSHKLSGASESEVNAQLAQARQKILSAIEAWETNK